MDIDDELLGAALEFAAAASSLAAQSFLQGAPASTKPNGSAVTPADVEVEDLLRSLIAARFPADGVTGEATTSCPGTAPSWGATGTSTTRCSSSSGTCHPAGTTSPSCSHARA